MKGFETSLLTMGMTVAHYEMKMNLSISNEEVNDPAIPQNLA
jgi:hypothetical protein